MKIFSAIFVILLVASFSGCSKVEYDFKALEFSSTEEMQAAFAKGYHTKQKLDEMLPPTIERPAPAPPEPSPASSDSTETKQDAVASTTQDNTPFSPSFDCSKASNKVEKLVCDDRELSKFDVELSKAYQTARDASTDKDQLKKDQISWVKFSRSCEDKACVKSAFEMRLQQLKNKN